MCHYNVLMACIEEMFQMHEWKAFRANHLETANAVRGGVEELNNDHKSWFDLLDT